MNGMWFLFGLAGVAVLIFLIELARSYLQAKLVSVDRLSGIVVVVVVVLAVVLLVMLHGPGDELLTTFVIWLPYFALTLMVLLVLAVLAVIALSDAEPLVE